MEDLRYRYSSTKRVGLQSFSAIGYHDQYRRSDALGHLETAIQRFQEALDATPDNHPDRARRLHNVGIGHYDRYLKARAIEDLEISIQRFQEAVNATPKNDPNWARRVQSLGAGYGEKMHQNRGHGGSGHGYPAIPGGS